MQEAPIAAGRRATIVNGALAHALTRLDLTEFRGFESLRLAVEPAPVVLTGANGAGKTNLLEAISFLAPGRGLRRARLAEVGRVGAARPWGVAATVRTPGREGRGRHGGSLRRRRRSPAAVAPRPALAPTTAPASGARSRSTAPSSRNRRSPARSR